MDPNLHGVSYDVGTTTALELRCARGLRSTPSGTRLPMHTAQAMTSAQPNKLFYDIELKRISEEIKRVKQNLSDKKSMLELEFSKEREEIIQKYNAKINEAETKGASIIKELEMISHKIVLNKYLTDAFCRKFDNIQEFNRPLERPSDFISAPPLNLPLLTVGSVACTNNRLGSARFPAANPITPPGFLSA